MTETPNAGPSTTSAPSGGPTRPPLQRSRDERVLAGVCAGVARYLGIDPILVRVIIVALTIFGGGGLLLYIAGWFLLPDQGRTQSPAQQLFGSGSTITIVVTSIVIAILSIWLLSGGWWLGMWPHYGPPGFLLLVGAIALTVWLVRRNNEESPPPTAPVGAQPSPSTIPTAEVTAVTSSTNQPTQVLEPPTAPPTQPPYYGTASYEPDPVPPAPTKPSRPRSVLGLLTVSVTALVAGILITINLVNGDNQIAGTTVLAASLAVVALGLLIGSFFGRSRGLIVFGIILSVATAATSALATVDLSGGVGDRNWRPVAVSDIPDQYRLGVGQATLDLRDLSVTGSQLSEPIAASVGLGQLRVFVPSDVDVQLVGDVGLGQIEVDGRQFNQSGGTTVNDLVIDVPNEVATVPLDLKVGIGDININPFGPNGGRNATLGGSNQNQSPGPNGGTSQQGNNPSNQKNQNSGQGANQ